MNRALRTGFLAAILLLFAFPAKGQATGDMSAGFAPYQSFHGGDFDTVNLSNGNLILNIPLFSYPQRGGKLTLDYQFFINSKWIQDTQVCLPGQTCYFAWGPPRFSPVPLYEGIIDTQFIYDTGKTFEISRGEELDAWAIVTPDSAVHQMGVNNSAGEITLDATGYFANGNTGTIPTLLMDRNGIRYTLSSNIVREDPNGNQISQNLSTSVVTGLFGRTTPDTVATTDFSGCTGPLTISSATLWSVPGP